MTSRRQFLKSASVLTAGAYLSPSVFAAAKKHRHVGLQLYTVRQAMQSDPLATLAKVASIGYSSVEGATYTGSQKFYGMEPKAFKSVLEKNKLIMPSSHYVLGQQKANGQDVKGTLLHDWDRAVDDAAEVGVKYMVCAYLNDSERGGADQYKKVAEYLNKAGERTRQSGIQMCYHNHDFEFKEKDGRLPYDVLLDETDKELVKMELDLYWTVKADRDPLQLFRDHPGRFPLWHVKDMDKTSQRSFTEVGNGRIDFKSIFDKADEAGMAYFFVEQDRTPGDPFTSITSSYNYIKKKLI